MTDAELVTAIAEGRTDALRQLHERYAPRLATRLAHRSSDSSLVDEAIQDTFVAVWKKPQGFRREGDVGAWLWGVAIEGRLAQSTDWRAIASFIWWTAAENPNV